MNSDQSQRGQSIYGRYWDHYVERWGKTHQPDSEYQWPGDEWGSERGWEGLFQGLFVPAGVKDWRRAVEIGQGSGKYTAKVLANSQAIVRAYDVSPRFLEVCEERCQEWIKGGRLSLHLLSTDRPDRMLSDLSACGWRRTVDGFYSIDSMVHVDLQYLIVYLITAGMTLKPGGKLTLTLADVTREPGFMKLLKDITWTFPAQGSPLGSGKFEWLSPDIVESIFPRLGFRLDSLINTQRDLRLVASLVDPSAAEDLGKYIVPTAK